MIRKYLRFYGFVQGVGFRYRAKYAAEFARTTVLSAWRYRGRKRRLTG